jgi:hypothetical protein
MATESIARAVVHARRNTSGVPPVSLLFPPDLLVLMMLSGDAVPLLDYLLESFLAAPSLLEMIGRWLITGEVHMIIHLLRRVTPVFLIGSASGYLSQLLSTS